MRGCGGRGWMNRGIRRGMIREIRGIIHVIVQDIVKNHQEIEMEHALATEEKHVAGAGISDKAMGHI